MELGVDGGRGLEPPEPCHGGADPAVGGGASLEGEASGMVEGLDDSHLSTFSQAATDLLAKTETTFSFPQSNMRSSLPADPLVGSIATQYMTNRAEHDRMAIQWTKRYAT